MSHRRGLVCSKWAFLQAQPWYVIGFSHSRKKLRQTKDQVVNGEYNAI